MAALGFNKLRVLLLLLVLRSCPGLAKRFVSDVVSHPEFDLKDAMVRFDGGTFSTGINDPTSKTGEYPVRTTSVKPFYIDMFPVSVAQFWKFRMEKPRMTTLAERNGSSLVPEKFVSERVRRDWSEETGQPGWLLVKGAQWDRPEGPDSEVGERLHYPVVHVSFVDAKLYCQWAGKRLPSENEWEFAARGERAGEEYPWGDRFRRNRMNTWQGKFPDEDKGYDGWAGLSPVDAYPAQNDHSVFDMLGNVWEWTTERQYDRRARGMKKPLFILKGGSYLDTVSGQHNFIVRTANRMSKPPIYTAHNVGFRCVSSEPLKHLHTSPEASTKPPRFHSLEEMRPSLRSRGRHQEL